ncbi:MAG: hypothetical protein WD336_05945, partial [Trueperaceae bacterium]
ERRVAELESHLPSYDRDPDTAVIPNRIPDRIPAVSDPYRSDDGPDVPGQAGNDADRDRSQRRALGDADDARRA